jgi:hypothetical protein
VQPTSPEPKSAELPRLIELMAPTVAGIAECVVELEGAGRRMGCTPGLRHRVKGVVAVH